jgi:hypothetical protein
LVDADDQETASDFTMLRNETEKKISTYTMIKLTGSSVRTILTPKVKNTKQLFLRRDSSLGSLSFVAA